MLNIPGPKPENRGAELQILLSSPALLLCSSWLPSIEDLSCSSELFTQSFFFSSKSPLDLQVVISQNTGLQISENWVFDLDLRCSSDPCSSLQFLPQEPLNLPWILHLQIFKAAAGPPSSSNLWIFKKQISCSILECFSQICSASDFLRLVILNSLLDPSLSNACWMHVV